MLTRAFSSTLHPNRRLWTTHTDTMARMISFGAFVVLVAAAAGVARASTTTVQCNSGWGCAPAVLLGSFPNGGVTGPLVSTGTNTFTIDGWTFYNERVQLNGNSIVAGFTTPTDTDIPPSCPCPDDDCVLDSESYSTAINSNSPPPGASSYADMSSSLTSALGYAIAHGPYMVSNSSIALKAGAVISFDWRANQGADSYDVYAYLLRTDGANAGTTIELLNQWGDNGAWEKKNVTIANAGDYTFVFMSGTWDKSGGRALGARLQITNVRIQGNTNVTSAADCVSACHTFDNATAFINFDATTNDCACSAACTTYAQGVPTVQALAIDTVRQGRGFLGEQIRSLRTKPPPNKNKTHDFYSQATCPNVPATVCGVDVACVAPTTAASASVDSLQGCVNQCSLDSGDNQFVKYSPTSTACLCQDTCLAQVPSPGDVSASFRRGTCSLFRT